jgi:hypothetical protein
MALSGEDKGEDDNTRTYLNASRLLKMSSLTRSGCFIPLTVTNRGRDR